MLPAPCHAAQIKAGLEGDVVDWGKCGLDPSTVMTAIYREADGDGDRMLSFEEFWKFATTHGKAHMDDPAEQVREYVAEHDLLGIMEQSLAALVFAKPDDPRAFLAQYLATLKKAGRKGTTFFTDEDLATMFGLFDLTGKGVMSPTQFDNAMKSLGIDKRPPKVGGPVTKENFVSMARAALDEGM